MMADDLERRAIIAAHDAECACGDVPSASLLTDREQAIIALWRADRHTAAAAVPDPDAGDDTLREQLAEALADARDKRDDQQRRTCTNGCGCRYMTEDPDQRDCACFGQCCTDPDWWDGRDYDEVLADTLLPRIREHVAAAVQTERERLITGFQEIGATYPDEVQRGLAIAALIIQKSSEADHGTR